MPIAYPADLEQFVQKSIASGKFRSREELVSAALTLYRYREEKLDRLREDIQIGIEQLDRGEFTAISSPEEHAAFRGGIKARGRERIGADRLVGNASRISSEVYGGFPGDESVHPFAVSSTIVFAQSRPEVGGGNGLLSAW